MKFIHVYHKGMTQVANVHHILHSVVVLRGKCFCELLQIKIKFFTSEYLNNAIAIELKIY